MREGNRSRRLSPHAFQPRQRRLGPAGSSAGWLRQLYTPRWRHHLAILFAASLVLPFGIPAARSGDLASAANPALAWLHGEPARPDVRYHPVGDSESLQSIAGHYGLAVETLRWANGLGDQDPIVVGQELLILPVDGVLHYLAAGESARQVALYYNADPDQVAAYNAVDPDRPLRAAQLVVPGGRPRLGQAVASIGIAGWSVGDISEIEALPEGAQVLQFGGRTVVVVEDRERREAADRVAAAPAKTWEEIQQDAERATAAAVAASTRKAPRPVEYEVRPGDTVGGLAERYGVSSLTIIAANELLNSDSLSVGQTLVIPPVTGVLYSVQEDDTLSEIAMRFRVDLGPIVDYNGLESMHALSVGQRLVIPGAEPERPKPPAPPEPPAAPAGTTTVARADASGYSLASTTGRAGSGPAAVTRPAGRAAPGAPPVAATTSGKGGQLVGIALQQLGKPYIWGATGPGGFDCSGLVYFVHRQAGIPLSRGMMGQYTAGPRIPQSQLEPGDIVFFSNTYMPGLSHNGIYIGGGKFVHASDPSVGVVITPLSSAYWASRYSGATRVY
jgi:peptidoglycan endopeptidase LytE